MPVELYSRIICLKRQPGPKKATNEKKKQCASSKPAIESNKLTMKKEDNNEDVSSGISSPEDEDSDDMESDKWEDNDSIKIEIDDAENDESGETKKKKVGRKKGQQYRSYHFATLKAAYNAVVKDGMPVYAAAKKFFVPQSTLRDRVLGRISAEVTTSGPPTIFSPEEEKGIASYIKLFSDIGHPLCRTKVRCLAGELAANLQRRGFTDGKILSLRWYYKLVDMFPDMQSQKFARSEFKEIGYGYYRMLDKLYEELGAESLQKRLFNLDIVHVQTDETQGKMVCQQASDQNEKDVIETKLVSDKDKSRMTFIGCSNVSGNKIPPCFVFASNSDNPSRKSVRKIHNGATVKYSATEQCTQEILTDYFKSHFTQFVKVGLKAKKLIVFYNSRCLTIPLILWLWGESNNVIFFPLPMTKTTKSDPKPKGCLHGLPQMFEVEQKLFQDKIPGIKLTTIDICKILNRLYSSLQMSHFELVFCAAGVFPLPVKTPQMLRFDRLVSSDKLESRKKKSPRKRKSISDSETILPKQRRRTKKSRKTRITLKKEVIPKKEGQFPLDWTGITAQENIDKALAIPADTQNKVGLERRGDKSLAQGLSGLENGVKLEAYDPSDTGLHGSQVYIQGAECTNQETEVVAEEVVIENIDYTADTWS